MPKGLVVEELVVGSGPKARRGNIVDVCVVMRLRKGDLLHEGLQTGLVLGLRRNIDGLERGIEGMQPGGKRRLQIPPHLGYRDGRMLVCEVELLTVNGYRGEDLFDPVR